MMNTPVLLLLCALLALLGCVRVRAAPLDDGSAQPGSCADPSALGAANLALDKINQDRAEGYVFNLHRLSNVHMQLHGEAGVVFYLTLDVVETNCSVLNKNPAKVCETRPESNVPVYGQCKAAIYVSKVHRVVRLYKYDCVIRPVPGSMVNRLCPDCPSLTRNDDEKVLKTVGLALESFNKDNKLTNHFALLTVNRATAGYAMSMYYNVEFTIQETTCDKTVFPAVRCPKMECEFAHKGFCKASMFNSPSGQTVNVECEIYEPEAANREKALHLLGGATDHSHKATGDHDHAHDAAHSAADHAHDHAHDHTKGHAAHDATHQHAAGSDHHHTHDHAPGSAHKHAHDHSHDHGHGHDHVHAHHAKAHGHDGDRPNQHHNYTHADAAHTHDHDHELALDHDHKHAHLHEHEHHHHHHEHEHETSFHDHPEGSVRTLPAMDPDTPMVLPAFPDAPAAGPGIGVTLQAKQDPQIPGVTEPTIEAFPGKLSAQCSTPVAGERILERVFAEDALFKAAA